MGAFISDISGHGALRIAGADAERFLSVMYAGDMDDCASVGCMSQGAVLTAQGEVIDLVSALRTGDDEFLVTGGQANRSELVGWLSAHAALADDAGPVFGDLSITDESAHLGILLLSGQDIAQAHADLIQACTGHIAVIDYEFDHLGYGVFCLPSYLLFAPINAASQIGDFLHEYRQIEILDEEDLSHACMEQGTYLPQLYAAAYVDAHDAALAPYLRPGGGFVGARALGM